MKILSKISVKTVVGNIKSMVRDGKIGDGDLIMRVFGQASRMVAGTGDLGDYVAFKGNITAINTLTGEEMNSGKMFLPGTASDLLEGALGSLDGNGSVEFGFDIGIEYDDTSATGYVYTVDTLHEPAEDDAVARLRQSLPALPGAVAKEKPAKKPAKK